MNSEVEFNEGVESENIQEFENDQSDNESVGDENSDDEYETIDVTQNPLYHVLSAFFEDDDGNNVVDKLNLLSDNLKLQTEVLNKTNKSLISLLNSLSKLKSTKTKKVKN